MKERAGYPTATGRPGDTRQEPASQQPTGAANVETTASCRCLPLLVSIPCAPPDLIFLSPREVGQKRVPGGKSKIGSPGPSPLGGGTLDPPSPPRVGPGQTSPHRVLKRRLSHPAALHPMAPHRSAPPLQGLRHDDVLWLRRRLRHRRPPGCRRVSD